MSTIGPISTGLVLRVIQGSCVEPLQALTRSVVSVGRTTPETPCTPAYITFPEPTVSRLHLVLTWEPGAKTYMVHHRSQTNATVLNGKPLTRSELLKPGDVLALGRLVVRVEQASDTEVLATESSGTENRLQICLRKGDQGARTFVVPIEKDRVLVSFSSDRRTAGIADPGSDPQVQRVTIPADISTDLSFQLSQREDSAEVEAHSLASPTVRRTLLHFGALELPASLEVPLEVTPHDALHHQGYVIWLSRQESPNPPSSTLEGSLAEEAPSEQKRTLSHLPSLYFLNGAWKGAVLRVSDKGTHSFSLSEDSMSFRHPLPFPDIPACRITVTDGVAQLRVGESRDDQFLDLNGDLLFPGESVSLVSGSKLLLGNVELHWELPELHKEYTGFHLSHDGNSYPITRQEMRIGTAAHCEIQIASPNLAPVVGTLKYTTKGFVYAHQNIALAARVDDVEVTAGLEQPVRCGSTLELAPGVAPVLEELPQTDA